MEGKEIYNANGLRWDQKMIKLGSIFSILCSIFSILYCLFFALAAMFYSMFYLWEISWAKRAGKVSFVFAASSFFVAIICLIIYALNTIPTGGF